ncbi:MAG: hypothetical protein K0S86_2549, partial [Geminicoccaceae bacterium]|nr:hypothetical protein [Geminicoccaceae bacterium]
MLLACGESVGSEPGPNVRDPDATTADTPLA